MQRWSERGPYSEVVTDSRINVLYLAQTYVLVLQCLWQWVDFRTAAIGLERLTGYNRRERRPIRLERGKGNR